MIVEYRNKSKLAGSVCIAMLVGMVASLPLAGPTPSQMWLVIQPLLSLSAGIAMIVALWFHLAAKNRSKAWLLLLIFNIVGVLIIFLLRDRSTTPNM